jgi:hypothetical protein
MAVFPEFRARMTIISYLRRRLASSAPGSRVGKCVIAVRHIILSLRSRIVYRYSAFCA